MKARGNEKKLSDDWGSIVCSIGKEKGKGEKKKNGRRLLPFKSLRRKGEKMSFF